LIYVPHFEKAASGKTKISAAAPCFETLAEDASSTPPSPPVYSLSRRTILFPYTYIPVFEYIKSPSGKCSVRLSYRPFKALGKRLKGLALGEELEGLGLKRTKRAAKQRSGAPSKEKWAQHGPVLEKHEGAFRGKPAPTSWTQYSRPPRKHKPAQGWFY
jgi:hypothetical protein